MSTTITLKQIKAHSPCKDGWEKLLKSLGKTKADDEALTFSYIAESNGVQDAIWCLRCLPDEHLNTIKMFACDIAEGVLPIYEAKHPNDLRPRKAIDAARDFIHGKITSDELNAAWAAAAAADAAAWAAAAAAWAAADAAAADAEREAQKQLLIKYFG